MSENKDPRQLSELYRMASIGRLTARVVHEINTPIGSIRSNNDVFGRALEILAKLLAESAENSAPPPKKAFEVLETLKSLADVDKIACERITSVIRGLKSYARGNEGRVEKTDLNELIRDTLKLAGCEFKRRITVVEEYGDIPKTECFPQLINQVFMNLIVNAGQSIEGEGTITIRTTEEDGWVRVSISDTGRGISPEHQSRIFTPGFTTKPIGEGTGLGLTISREIVVDTHHGEITFESQPGIGTAFHIRIPLIHSRRS